MDSRRRGNFITLFFSSALFFVFFFDSVYLFDTERRPVSFLRRLRIMKCN